MGNKKSKQKQKPNREEISESIRSKEKTFRILLLGHSHAGKSTIFKSISFGHKTNNAIDPNEFKSRIREDCIANMTHLLAQSQILYDEHNLSECKISVNDVTKQAINTITSLNPGGSYSYFNSFPDLNATDIKAVGDAIDTIWNVDGIQAIYYKYRVQQKYWFHLNDNIDDFYNKIHDIMNIEYIPSQQDILKTRVPTTGAIEQVFEDAVGTKFTIWDVGGQRIEQKKWLHCFENIECVICVCALTGYFQTDFGNKECLQINECMTEFGHYSNAKYFAKTQMIVLLNKTDLFYKYLQIIPLTACFGDEYKGRNYSDFSDDSKRRVIQKLLKLIVKNIDVGMDIVGIIEKYCDLVYGYWLDMVYKDGIEFIKNKFLNLHQDTVFYQVSALEPENVKQIIQKLKI